jgi:hypothetical protein
MPMHTMRLPSVYCRKAFTTKNVLSMRDWFEMCWIHAMTNSAKMIESKFFSNYSVHTFIDPTMRKTRPTFIPEHRIATATAPF